MKMLLSRREISADDGADRPENRRGDAITRCRSRIEESKRPHVEINEIETSAARELRPRRSTRCRRARRSAASPAAGTTPCRFSFASCCRRARPGPAVGGACLRHLAATRVQVALADDPQEQLFERGGRVVDRHISPPWRGSRRGSPRAPPGQVAGLDLGHVLDRQQVGDLAELLELAAVEDRDPVADVLHVGQQVAGEHDRLALLLRSRISSLISAVPIGSRPEVGSSSRISSGLLIRAWARPIRRCMPFGVFAELAVLGRRQADHVDQAADPLGPLGRRDLEQPAVEVERFLGVEELVEVRLFGQVADPLVLGDVGRRLVEDERVALGGKSRPSRSLIVVVLPEPLGPSRPKISPRWTLRSRALSAWTLGRPQKSR